jgi:hypothetical protein
MPFLARATVTSRSCSGSVNRGSISGPITRSSVGASSCCIKLFGLARSVSFWASWTNCLNPSEMGVPSQRVGELRLAALSCSPQGQATSRVLRGSDVSHSAYAADEESEGASLAIAMRRRGRCHTGRTCASRVASELSLCVRDGAGDRRQVKQNGRQCLPNVESKSGVL